MRSPLSGENIKNALAFVGQTMALGTIIYVGLNGYADTLVVFL